jgi:hypothetical protein
MAPGARASSSTPKAVEVGPEVRLVRVRLADFADLAPDGDRDPLGLQLADERGDLGSDRVVDLLFQVDGRLVEVDQGGAVDVDVEVARGDRVAAGLADLLGHRLGVRGVLLGVELVVVALDEDWTDPARRDGAGEDVGRVLEDPLPRVGLLRAGELQDHRPDGLRLRRLEHLSRRVEGVHPDVDGRDGEAGELAPRARGVEVLDAGRAGAQRLACLPDDPAGGLDGRGILGEGLGPGEVFDRPGTECRLVGDDDAVALDAGAAVEKGDQLRDGGGDGGHGARSPVRGARPRPRWIG